MLAPFVVTCLADNSRSIIYCEELVLYMPKKGPIPYSARPLVPAAHIEPSCLTIKFTPLEEAILIIFSSSVAGV